MDYSQIGQVVIDSMAVVITALVGLAVVYIKGYITKRIENEEFNNSVMLTLTTLENSVKSSIQKLGASAKTAVADGTISPPELKQIQNEAVKHFTEQVSPELQARLKAHVGDMESFLTSKIAAELQKAEKVTG